MDAAAVAIQQTIDAAAVRRVRDLDARREEFGDHGLAAAVSEFCTRWDIGLENLGQDAREIVQRLQESAATYGAAEQHATAASSGAGGVGASAPK